LEAVLAFIRQSASVEAKIHVSLEQLVGAIERGEDLRLLDVRSAEEWQAGRIPGAQLVTVELTFEALDSWPKETPIVFYSNEGRRSLDKAAYFQAYGFTNARSLDGGIQAWPGKIESTLAGWSLGERSS
jgi:rhodanese-related sulfurtransferase